MKIEELEDLLWDNFDKRKADKDWRNHPLDRKLTKELIKNISKQMPLSNREKRELFHFLLKKHYFAGNDYRAYRLCLIEFYVRCPNFSSKEDILKTKNLVSLYHPYRTFPWTYMDVNSLMKPITMNYLDNLRFNFKRIKELENSLDRLDYYENWIELFCYRLPEDFLGNFKEAIEKIKENMKEVESFSIELNSSNTSRSPAGI